MEGAWLEQRGRHPEKRCSIHEKDHPPCREPGNTIRESWGSNQQVDGEKADTKRNMNEKRTLASRASFVPTKRANEP